MVTAANKVPWSDRLREITGFLRLHGRFPGISASDIRERSLANWRNRNLRLLKKNLLDRTRAELFVAAGISKRPPRIGYPKLHKYDGHWTAMMSRVAAFTEKWGRFPSPYGITEEERVIGAWRGTQDRLYRKGLLSEKRAGLLERSGLVGNYFDRKWRNMLKRAVLFRKKHGRVPEARSSSPQESLLGAWRERNRYLFLHKRLSPRRATLLQAADLVKLPPKRDTWSEKYKALEEFCRTRNRLPSVTDKGEDRKVFGWYMQQRSSLRGGSLSGSRAELMRTIRARYKPLTGDRSDRWDARYRATDLFIRRHNRLPRCKCDSGFERECGKWLGRQKQKFRNEELSLREIRMLQRLPGCRDLREWAVAPEVKGNRAWEERLEHVRVIIRATGKGPAKKAADVRERNLLRWFTQQKALARQNRLPPERRSVFERVLEMLPVRPPRALPIPGSMAAFQERIREVVAFVETHARFPSYTRPDDAREGTLASWRNYCNTSINRGLFSQERKALFLAAGLGPSQTVRRR